MRENFQKQLQAIEDKILTTGRDCIKAFNLLNNYLFKKDTSVYEQIFDKYREIKAGTTHIEELCMRVLYRQQPVAQDLNFISIVLKVTTDLKRIGSQITEIAVLSQEIDQNLDGLKEDLCSIARVCLEMLQGAVENFHKPDVKAAEWIINEDATIDRSYLELKNKIRTMIVSGDTLAVDPIDVLLIAKYFERIADHSVNIAKSEKNV